MQIFFHCRNLVLLLALAGPSACAASTTSDEPAAAGPMPEGATARLDVSNRSSVDMDIFLVRSGQRAPIGLAPASDRTTFTLSRSMLAGGSVYFEAVPRGSSAGARQPVRSDPVTIGPGQIATFDVPPQ